MGIMGVRELIIILLVVLVVFGTKKLRTIGSDIGGAIRGFKTAMNDGAREGAARPEHRLTDSVLPLSEKKPAPEGGASPKTDQSA